MSFDLHLDSFLDMGQKSIFMKHQLNRIKELIKLTNLDPHFQLIRTD